MEFKDPEIGKVAEVIEEREKAAKVRTKIPYFFLTKGGYEVRTCDLYVWVPKAAVDDDGYITPALLAEKIQPVVFKEINDYKAKNGEAAPAAEATPEPAQV